jgi:AcrR family transcriptional regulator
MEGLANSPGNVRESHPPRINYEEIENKTLFPPPPKREHDRIFQAIVDVSASVGIREASIERIAEKLGMSKSSLYSHFRSKRSMFETLLREEQRFLLRVLKEKLSSLSGFAERSYGFMYITLRHTLSNPSLLSLFNWFRFQNIRIPIRPPGRSFMEEYFNFFFEAHEKGELSCTKEELIPAAVLLHVLTFRSLRDTASPQELSETLLTKIRTMHQLYLYGLTTPHLSKESV